MKVFIDGSHGTTGLRIHERLEQRNDIELISLSFEDRHNLEKRTEAINAADIVFLCLPDDAAREAVGLCQNPGTVIIDTATAHRTSPGWTYGMAELEGMTDKIKSAKRIANPGCHASGFIALVQPLVANGILDKGEVFSCLSLTGYSGGGKKMIAEYEASDRNPLLDAPRMYGLTQEHKHLKEMKIICSLEKEPLFMPVVASFYSGMETVIPLSASQVNGTRADIEDIYRQLYGNGLIRYAENIGENGFASANAFSGRDDMQVGVSGNDERILLVARFDNLGKGASGAAIQNMNIAMGVDPCIGLSIGG